MGGRDRRSLRDPTRPARGRHTAEVGHLPAPQQYVVDAESGGGISKLALVPHPDPRWLDPTEVPTGRAGTRGRSPVDPHEEGHDRGGHDRAPGRGVERQDGDRQNGLVAERDGTP
jgi:hypothetical protein